VVAVLGAPMLVVGGFVTTLPGPIDLPLGATVEGPALTTPQVVRMVAVGDAGKDNPGARAVAAGVARVCGANPCDFGVLLGDNLYPNGMESADDPRMNRWVRDRYQGLGFPWYLVLGNHDYQGWLSVEVAQWEMDWANVTPGFELPATAYTFSAGPARFIAIDTTRVFWNGIESHSPWIETVLSRPAPPWSIGFGHHPIRSNGHHGNAGEYEGFSWIPWASGHQLDTFGQQIVCPEFDVWISGHEHNLQLIEHCDTTFIVSGAGGSLTALRDRGNHPLFAAAEMGFVILEVRAASLDVAFYDRDGNPLHRQVLDPPRRDR
jgi:tartrate-resistant acid phosphatase type 5